MARRSGNPFENAFNYGYNLGYGSSGKKRSNKARTSYSGGYSYKRTKMNYESPEEIGRKGEDKVVEIIDSSTIGKILKNVYVPKADSDETSECDIVFICKKGIFVFESKYFRSCKLSGKENEEKWYVQYEDTEYSFFNPIMQNNSHIRHLSNYLGIDKSYFHSVIVFSDTVAWNGLDVSGESNVIRIEKLEAKLRSLYDNITSVMNDDAILKIYNKLKELSKVDDCTKKKHIDDINNKYGSQSDDISIGLPTITQNAEKVELKTIPANEFYNLFCELPSIRACEVASDFEYLCTEEVIYEKVSLLVSGSYIKARCKQIAIEYVYSDGINIHKGTLLKYNIPGDTVGNEIYTRFELINSMFHDAISDLKRRLEVYFLKDDNPSYFDQLEDKYYYWCQKVEETEKKIKADISLAEEKENESKRFFEENHPYSAGAFYDKMMELIDTLNCEEVYKYNLRKIYIDANYSRETMIGDGGYIIGSMIAGVYTARLSRFLASDSTYKYHFSKSESLRIFAVPNDKPDGCNISGFNYQLHLRQWFSTLLTNTMNMMKK